MSGWTKGEWGGDPRNPTDIPIAGQYEVGISLGFVMGDEARMAEGRANARLIAAAPDLAEALEIFADPASWRVGGRCDPTSGNFDGDAIARAALLKAKGE